MAARSCPSCGAPWEPGQKLCPYCGRSVAGRDAAAARRALKVLLLAAENELRDVGIWSVLNRSFSFLLVFLPLICFMVWRLTRSLFFGVVVGLIVTVGAIMVADINPNRDQERVFETLVKPKLVEFMRQTGINKTELLIAAQETLGERSCLWKYLIRI